MRNLYYIGAAAMALGMFSAEPAVASSHREAPSIALDPAADNTDVWAWASPDKTKMYIVAAYNPLEEPAGGPNFNKFADEVLYEIHITPSGSSGPLNDKITYQFRFRTTPLTRGKVDDPSPDTLAFNGREFFAQLSGQNQTMSVTKITYGPSGDVVPIAAGVPVAPPNIGPRTDAVVRNNMPYNDAYAKTFIRDLDGGGRVWAGPRDDGFYVDLGGVFDLANLRAKGTAQDNVNHYNCHAIAIEIPTTQLTADGQAPGNTPSNRSTVGVWASASRRQVKVLFRDGTDANLGPFIQVSRQGLPLINEAVIGLQDKDKYNRTRPVTDVANFGAYFLFPVIVRDAKAVGIYTAVGKDAKDFQKDRADIIKIINLDAGGGLGNIPNADTYKIPLMGGSTGDVQRVDMAVANSFPNGRPLGMALTGAANKENDVTDILLSVLLLKTASGISDGVDRNDVNYLNEFPWLALPWRGFDQGHGVPTP